MFSKWFDVPAFRHAAAAVLLEAYPGNYELVKRVLGHRNLNTTVKFYVGLETVAAAKQFAELVLRDDPQPPKGKSTP